MSGPAYPGDNDRERAELINRFMGGKATLEAANGALGLPTLPEYTGFVATGCYAPNNTVANNRSVKGTTVHVVRDVVDAIQLQDVNRYHNSTSPFEYGTGAPLTVRRWVEYPLGSGFWLPVKYNGADRQVIADGAIGAPSDVLPLLTSTSRNALMRIAFQMEHSIGCPAHNFANQSYTAGGNNNLALINRQFHGSTVAGTFINEEPSTWVLAGTTIQSAYPPAAIIGLTKRPAIAFYGNSRDQGSNEWQNDGAATITTDGGTDHGQLCGTLGLSFAYGNYGTSGDKLQNFVIDGNATMRSYFARYASHVGFPDTINDINAGRTRQQMLADALLFFAMFPDKKVIAPTVSPVTTVPGGQDFITGTQTAHANNQVRIDWNGMLRSGQVPNIQALFDIAAVNENTLNGGLWGTWNGKARTADGTHNNYNGFQAIRQSGIIDPSRLYA